MDDILKYMASLTIDDIKSLEEEVKKDDNSEFELYIPCNISEFSIESDSFEKVKCTRSTLSSGAHSDYGHDYVNNDFTYLAA